MIFPIGDTNVKGGYKPLFSYSFIGINVLIFLLQIVTPGNLVCGYATIPDDIMAGNHLYTLMTSMFLHGGWMHLIGNMLFLWVFADNIEAVIGNTRFLLFYLCGGIVASMIHIGIDIWFGAAELANCCSPCAAEVSCQDATSICPGSVPSLGASGAISALLGAYIVLFPKSKIKVLIFFYTTTISALVFLGLWFGEQLISGIGALSPLSAQAEGVAWWAHIGGFLFGLIFGWLNREATRGLKTVNA
jgi:membrane associated rhomboid family serine protease